MGTNPTADPVTSARALLTEQNQSVTMTHAEVWRVLARYQRRLTELLAVAEATASPVTIKRHAATGSFETEARGLPAAASVQTVLRSPWGRRLGARAASQICLAATASRLAAASAQAVRRDLSESAVERSAVRRHATRAGGR